MKERTLLKSHSSLQGALCKKSWFLSHPTRQILKAFGWRPTRPLIQKYLTSWGSHTRIYFLANGTLNVPRSCSQSKTDPSINNQDWESTTYQEGSVVKSVNVHPTPTQTNWRLVSVDASSHKRFLIHLSGKCFSVYIPTLMLICRSGDVRTCPMMQPRFMKAPICKKRYIFPTFTKWFLPTQRLSGGKWRSASSIRSPYFLL